MVDMGLLPAFRSAWLQCLLVLLLEASFALSNRLPGSFGEGKSIKQGGISAALLK